MKHRFGLVPALLSIFSLLTPVSFAKLHLQDSPSSQPPAAPQASDGSATSNNANTPLDPKKHKKVWTNENLTEVSGSAISQIGDATNGQTRKRAVAKPVSAQVLTSVRKQIAALAAQLNSIDKQIADLKSFSKGEVSGANGMQLHKSYSMEPVLDQVSKLEEKRKILAAQMDAVFDTARKRGIEPGQLR